MSTGSRLALPARRMTWKPLRYPRWTGASGNPEQTVAAVTDVRARIGMRLRRIERQVRNARTLVENGHDFPAILADVSAAREALQALARNISVVQGMAEEAPGCTEAVRGGRPAVRPLSRGSLRGDA